MFTPGYSLLSPTLYAQPTRLAGQSLSSRLVCGNLWAGISLFLFQQMNITITERVVKCCNYIFICCNYVVTCSNYNH